MTPVTACSSTGDRFTQETAAFGNDLVTLPNFPAEIRAPQGTLPGVSSFQVHFADHDILTAGRRPRRAGRDEPGGVEGQHRRPEQGCRDHRRHPRLHRPQPGQGRLRGEPARGRLAGRVRAAQGGPDRDDGRGGQGVRLVPQGRGSRAKNMFALGLLSWMYGRPTETTDGVLVQAVRQGSRHPRRQHPRVQERAGTSARPPRRSSSSTRSSRPSMPPGHLPQHQRQPGPVLRPDRRPVCSPGCRSSSAPTRSPRPPTSSTSCPSTRASGSPPSRPRTRSPASAPRSAPSFAGHLGVTTTSGPGISLKCEAIGLAVMTELPLLVVNVQRGGPSTGLPTKTEQSDLLQAMFGRNGEAPVPIVAPQSPADCFDAAVEAVRIAVTYRTPVMLLSDGYLANGSEPWQIPDVASLPAIDPALRHRPEQGNHQLDRRDRSRSSCPTCATRRRWRVRGRSPAPPDSSTASAASRRATATATSPTTRPTTTSWSAPARPRSTGSPTRCPRSRSTTPPGTARRCWCSGGARPTARSVPAYAASARPASTSPRPTCATSTRSRTTSATS